MDERLERNKNPDRPYPYRADDGREDPNLLNGEIQGPAPMAGSRGIGAVLPELNRERS